MRDLEVLVLEKLDWRTQVCTMTGLLECAEIYKWDLNEKTRKRINAAILRCYQSTHQDNALEQCILYFPPNGPKLFALACVEVFALNLSRICFSNVSPI